LKKLAISSLGLARFKQYGAFPPRNIFSPAFRFTRQLRRNISLGKKYDFYLNA